MEQQRKEYHRKIREHLSTAYLLTQEKIEVVLPRFLETIRTLMSEIEKFSATGENEALSRSGHAMKGALLSLGLKELAEKAFLIEKQPPGCSTNQECIKMIAELKKDIQNIL